MVVSSSATCAEKGTSDMGQDEFTSLFFFLLHRNIHIATEVKAGKEQAKDNAENTPARKQACSLRRRCYKATRIESFVQSTSLHRTLCSPSSTFTAAREVKVMQGKRPGRRRGNVGWKRSTRLKMCFPSKGTSDLGFEEFSRPCSSSCSTTTFP